jgi:putative DNA primase/helicase
LAPVPNKYGVEDKSPMIHNRAGYWDDAAGERVYLFTSAGFRDATKGFPRKRVTEALDKVGAFTETDTVNRKYAKLERVPDGRGVRLYHIDPCKLQ